MNASTLWPKRWVHPHYGLCYGCVQPCLWNADMIWPKMFGNVPKYCTFHHFSFLVLCKLYNVLEVLHSHRKKNFQGYIVLAEILLDLLALFFFFCEVFLQRQDKRGHAFKVRPFWTCLNQCGYVHSPLSAHDRKRQSSKTIFHQSYTQTFL